MDKHSLILAVVAATATFLILSALLGGSIAPDIPVLKDGSVEFTSRLLTSSGEEIERATTRGGNLDRDNTPDAITWGVWEVDAIGFSLEWEITGEFVEENTITATAVLYNVPAPETFSQLYEASLSDAVGTFDLGTYQVSSLVDESTLPRGPIQLYFSLVVTFEAIGLDGTPLNTVVNAYVQVSLYNPNDADPDPAPPDMEGGMEGFTYDQKLPDKGTDPIDPRRRGAMSLVGGGNFGSGDLIALAVAFLVFVLVVKKT